MNIGMLKEGLEQIKEAKPIGRTMEAGERMHHVMGMALQNDGTLQLVLLTYDEAARIKEEEAEAREAEESGNTLRTNRASMQRSDIQTPFGNVSKVWIGSREFSVKQAAWGRGRVEQWDKAALFARFLLAGWEPNCMGAHDIESVYVTELSLDGTYDQIPALPVSGPIRFSLGMDSRRSLLEMPLYLRIGDGSSERMWFTDRQTGQKHWFCINRVYLCDMWAGMEKLFAEMRLKGEFSPKELKRQEKDFAKRFLKCCPRGMYYPVVEYECEEGISLQFYSKAFLDAAVSTSGSGMIIIMKPEETTGKMGLPLKAEVIDEPYAQGTEGFDAELFSYHEMISGEELSL